MSYWTIVSLIVIAVFAASFLLGEWLVHRSIRRDELRDR